MADVSKHLLAYRMGKTLNKKPEVIDAALALFMRKGIKATTTRDIALRAGISEGTIYRHFQSKDELAQNVFQENLNYFYSYLKGYLKHSQGPESMLRTFVEGFFEFSRVEQRRYSFLMAAHQTELKQLSRTKMKPKRMLTRILRIGEKAGVFQFKDLELTGVMLMGMIMQTIFYLKNGHITVPFDNVVEEVYLNCLKTIAKTK